MAVKKWCYPFLVLLFGVFLCHVAAVVAVAGLLSEAGGVNSHPHNLSKNSSASIQSTTEDRICVFCHTPHGGSSSGPLWNRIDPVGPFPLYNGGGDGLLNIADNATIKAAADYKTDSAAGYPNGSSRLCMSCHDGVTAVGEVIVGGTLGTLAMSAYGTVDLSSSHPISFIYDVTVRGLLGGGFSAPPVGLLDGTERMQCTTCHDPHTDTKNATYLNPMWRHYTDDTSTNTDYDATCLYCHGSVPGAGGGLH